MNATITLLVNNRRTSWWAQSAISLCSVNTCIKTCHFILPDTLLLLTLLFIPTTTMLGPGPMASNWNYCKSLIGLLICVTRMVTIKEHLLHTWLCAKS